MSVPERYPGYTHMALYVTDIVAFEKAINDLGIEITEGPMEVKCFSYVIRIAMLLSFIKVLQLDPGLVP